MDKNKLKQLAGIPVNLSEKNPTGSMQSSGHPAEAMFATAPKEEIVKYLKETYKEFKSAMSALNFYINRAGKNLSSDRKKVLESCKQALRDAYGVKESVGMDFLRKIAGLPPKVSEDRDEEVESGEEMPEDETEETADDEQEDEVAINDEEALLNAPDIVAQIAAKAEGKTGQELVDLISMVYDAGVSDGKFSKEMDDEEMDDEEEAEENEMEGDDTDDKEVKEHASLSHSFNIDNEQAAAKACISLAKAGLTADMEEAVGVFYFNFKDEQQLLKAKKILGMQ